MEEKIEPTFESFGKIPRLRRNCQITEKIDGTNAQIIITPDNEIYAGSRTRLITPGKTTDNFGFAQWVQDNKEDLMQLGIGRHFGEWWGCGINRAYNKSDRTFSLFNVTRYREGREKRPECCSVVPLLYEGPFNDSSVNQTLETLAHLGSEAKRGFMDPEGIVVYLAAARQLFKVTLKDDEKPKGSAE